MNISNSILEAIDIMIEERIKNLSFNYMVEGKIIKSNQDNTYTVLINGIENKVYATDNKYQVGDVVLVIVMNNNYSNKWIFGLKSGVSV